MIVERYVRLIKDDGSPEDNLQPLSDFESQHAWVLLGEPGAGKSTIFEHEAEKTQSCKVRINDFLLANNISSPIEKPIFLDGLDEVRDSKTLISIREKLKALGYPPFRISCRAADWYGNVDREDIKSAAISGDLKVLQLEPFDDTQIEQVLKSFSEITDTAAFIEKAIHTGIYEALRNPLFLDLFAKTIKHDNWPNSRAQVYQQACEKLAKEENAYHRRKQAQNNERIATTDIINAAGHLCAILLLSNHLVISEDMLDMAGINQKSAQAAIKSKLFIPDGEKRLIPAHRTIAEYLAANWLSKKLDAKGLPLKRILNLLVGRDGKAVAGLRGLYAWLASLSKTAKDALIENDPYTVLVYGDVASLDVTAKKQIVAQVFNKNHHELTQFFDAATTARFAPLAIPELEPVFLQALQAKDTDENTQCHQKFIIKVIQHTQPQADVAKQLLALIKDEKRWPGVRKSALDAWLQQKNSKQKLDLLNEISHAKIKDENDDLAGTLLTHLYPEHIPAQDLLQHLHPLKDQNLTGRYLDFWTYHLIDKIPDNHIPILLDHLVNRPEIFTHDRYQKSLNRLPEALLAKGIMIFGDTITDDRLFNWLGIGFDEEYYDTSDDSTEIQMWLSDRPHRYLALLEKIINNCKSDTHINYCVTTQKLRLHAAIPPSDIAIWHLQQASLSPIDQTHLIDYHLRAAIDSLSNETNMIAKAMELLDAWRQQNLAKQHLLDVLLVYKIGERLELAKKNACSKKINEDITHQHTQVVNQNLSAIQEGSASSTLMYNLAALYSPDNNPETIKRFANSFTNGKDILTAAESGFRNCIKRNDIPSFLDIIKLKIEQKRYHISQPCLIGMQLSWQENPQIVKNLEDDKIKSITAFLFTNFLPKEPEWFSYYLQERADLITEVVIANIKALLKAGFVDSGSLLHNLGNNPLYRKVAQLAIPPLLKGFPTLANTSHLPYLEQLLKAALNYDHSAILNNADKKTTSKGNDAAKKVYWYAAAAFAKPSIYENQLWEFIDHSSQRTQHLLNFLNDNRFELMDTQPLCAKSLSNLIAILSPHAEVEWPKGGGLVTDAMRRGRQIETLIHRLSAMASADAENEIQRLMTTPTLHKLNYRLKHALHDLQQRRREKEFSFYSPADVAKILANQEPTSPSDLAALVLDHLDDLIYKIQNDNDDATNSFWDKDHTMNKKHQPKIENECRDQLMFRLRAYLTPFHIGCEREVDYAKHKRADLRISYREYETPIEIKKNDNKELWSGLHDQLINQYSRAPHAGDHGIYLVLWFDSTQTNMRHSDNGKKPSTPQELRSRLENLLTPDERSRIFIRVLDLSKPS